ncbi:hypothetical protein QUA35_20750 [Microcoleus sp. N9_B2]|uniref:Cas10/Cmr2 second palm domain-containing protein n=1 Tax=unclassified Microcoleus TaxID=2642155 RepID=UPI002FD60E1C
MKNFTVTVLDTTGIQPYIYGSNRLRENIGASYLVSQATDDWAREALNTFAQKDINRKVYAFDPTKHQPDAKPHIEDEENGLAAELVYAGGGNTVLLFSDEKYAVEFTKILSKKILEEAPGINLVAVHKNFDWDSQSLYKVVQELMKNDLDIKKRSRIPSAPLLGLGVTAVCRSTQLVAVGMSEKFESDEGYLISREIDAKHKVVSKANDKLQQIFATSLGSYQFPLRTDKMGRSQGDSSYAAVIHADGNGMGKRFQNFGAGKSNRDYIIAMRQLSHSVNQAGINALRKVVEILVKSIIDVEENGKTIKKVMGKFAIEGNNLPFRPLVYGGDDVTFVCDGRLGLELAAIFLQEFEEQTIADGEPIKACAGICVVKTHYPFARAYQLSEDLCRQAKKFVKEDENKGDFSALDWHLAASGLSGSISDIRQREYSVKIPDFDKVASLSMRPVSLKKEQDTDWRTWEGFTKVVQHFNEDQEWKARHNKVIALRDVLRQGIDATKNFLKNYRIKNEQLPTFPECSGQGVGLAEKGWLDGICGYFDAIEAMEFYISLREECNADLSTDNTTAE